VSPEYRFFSRHTSYQIYVGDDELALTSRSGKKDTGSDAADVIRIRFLGAGHGTVAGERRLPGVVNYLIGADSRLWRRRVPTYSTIVRRSIYPGIDVAFHQQGRRLEYDFVLAPGARPENIRLAYSGVSSLSLTHRGDLRLNGALPVIQKAPIAYQRRTTGIHQVPARYVLRKDKRVGIELGSYDRSQPLVIDPLLDYGGFLGGSGNDSAEGVALDASDNIYVAGTTDSIDLPGSLATTTRLPAAAGTGNEDAFVIKLDPTGSNILFTTYLGGAASDRVRGLAVDSSGQAHISGRTASSDFPLQAAAQSCGMGADDAFVAKLNAGGDALVFSSCVGGSNNDSSDGIALGAAGDVYITGFSDSGDFAPRTEAPAPAGSADAFVTRFNTTGVVQYSRLFGGSLSDGGRALAVDGAGNALVTGYTGSSNLATPGVFQGQIGGNGDAFVASFDSSGALGFATYLGGRGFDQGQSIALGSGGNVYVGGLTASIDFPVTAKAFQPTQASSGLTRDGFVAKLDANGKSLLYSTFIGGQRDDLVTAIVVDDVANIVAVGQTQAGDFPVKQVLQPVLLGTTDTFIAKFNPGAATAADSLVFSTYLGGEGDELANAVARKSGVPAEYYIAGSIAHPDLSPARPLIDEQYVAPDTLNFPRLNQLAVPAASPVQSQEAGMNEAFVAAISDASLSADLQLTRADDLTSVVVNTPFSYTLTVRNLGGATANNVVLVDTYDDTPIPPPLQITVQPSSGGTCNVSAVVVTCSFGAIVPNASGSVKITALPTLAAFYKRTALIARASTVDPELANNRISGTTKVVDTDGGGSTGPVLQLLLLVVVLTRCASTNMLLRR